MDVDVIILGAGAAGLMCAGFAARNGARTVVLDHAKRAGEKIRISGGGRCNFTNMYCAPSNFLSQNPHFAKSALARYTQWDFIDMVARHGIAYHEKTLGQLFCDGKSQAIIDMLLAEAAPAQILTGTDIKSVSHDGRYTVATSQGTFRAPSLVVATGGKSIPKMGATGLAYQIAEQFGHVLTPTRPALVPFTFGPQDLSWIAPLAGTALPIRATGPTGPAFDEAMLFTHRGMSGPALLQISSYWTEGAPITLNLSPGTAPFDHFKNAKQTAGRKAIFTTLGEIVPHKLAQTLAAQWDLTGNTADWSDARLQELSDRLTQWEITPQGTEGYRTAEVTLGGVDTDGLNSQTMESKRQPGLYFIGECVDVTGWLGGFNFQWAWSSGWAAGTAIAARAAAG